MEILDENECNGNLIRLEIKIGKIQLYSLCFGVMCEISHQKKIFVFQTVNSSVY